MKMLWKILALSIATAELFMCFAIVFGLIFKSEIVAMIMSFVALAFMIVGILSLLVIMWREL